MQVGGTRPWSLSSSFSLITTSKHHRRKQRALQLLTAALSTGQQQLEEASRSPPGVLAQAAWMPTSSGQRHCFAGSGSMLPAPTSGQSRATAGAQGSTGLVARCQAAGMERGRAPKCPACGSSLPELGCGGSHSMSEAAVAAPEARRWKWPCSNQGGAAAGHLHCSCCTGQPSGAHTRQPVAREAVPQPAEPAFSDQGDSTPGESASTQSPAAVAVRPSTGSLLQGAAEAPALLGSTS